MGEWWSRGQVRKGFHGEEESASERSSRRRRSSVHETWTRVVSGWGGESLMKLRSRITGEDLETISTDNFLKSSAGKRSREMGAWLACVWDQEKASGPPGLSGTAAAPESGQGEVHG